MTSSLSHQGGTHSQRSPEAWGERYAGTKLGELRELDPDLYEKVLAQMRDAAAVGAEFDEDDEYNDEDVARFAAELSVRMLTEKAAEEEPEA